MVSSIARAHGDRSACRRRRGERDLGPGDPVRLVALDRRRVEIDERGVGRVRPVGVQVGGGPGHGGARGRREPHAARRRARRSPPSRSSPVAARRLCTDWIAACSWYGPTTPSASARARCCSARSMSARDQLDTSCSASGTNRPAPSRRAAARASLWSISADAGRAPRPRRGAARTTAVARGGSLHAARSARFGSRPVGSSQPRAVRGVDRVEHEAEPVGQLVGFRHAVRDARRGDALLGANELLAQRAGPHEEGRRRSGPRRGRAPPAASTVRARRRASAGCVHANSSSSRRSGNADAGGVRPSSSASIASVGAARCAVSRRRCAPISARRGRGEHPRLRRVGHTSFRPGAQRGDERVGERVLGGGEVVGADGEQRDQAAVGRAHHVLDRLVGCSASCCDSVRTSAAASVAPRPRRSPADGHRSAHSSAASRSGTSITK